MLCHAIVSAATCCDLLRPAVTCVCPCLQYIEQELARVPPHVARRNSKQLWSVVFIPQVGFVITVSGGKLSEELLELLPDYKLAFMGEDGPAGFAGAAAADAGIELDRGCAYYTCDGTQQLDAEYGDLQRKIQDLEVSHDC